MNASVVFLSVTGIVIGVVAFFIIRTLLQMNRTLEKMDATMTDVQQVLDHAERLVLAAEIPVRTISGRIADLERGTKKVGLVIDRLGLDIIRPLAVTASAIQGVSSALGLIRKSKGGNNDF